MSKNRGDIMTETEQKEIVMKAINSVSDKRILDILTRLIYGILKDSDNQEISDLMKIVDYLRREKA